MRSAGGFSAWLPWLRRVPPFFFFMCGIGQIDFVLVVALPTFAAVFSLYAPNRGNESMALDLQTARNSSLPMLNGGTAGLPATGERSVGPANKAGGHGGERKAIEARRWLEVSFNHFGKCGFAVVCVGFWWCSGLAIRWLASWA